RQRQAARKRPPTKVEHAGTFDSTIPDEGDVGGTAADVHEQPAFRPDLLAGTCSGQREGLRHRGRQLQVELLYDGPDGVDVGHRREGVEDGDLEVLTREADGVAHRIPIDSHVRDRRVDEAGLELPVASLKLEEM